MIPKKQWIMCAALFAVAAVSAIPLANAEDPDWCNLQWPAAVEVETGQPTELIYGQVYELGITPQPGAYPGLMAQLGYGPDGSDPAQGGWTWVNTTWNAQVGDNDEYMGTLTLNSPGTYDYAYRYRIEGGAYCYGDLDGSANGYDPAQAGSLTVTGSPIPTRTPTSTPTQGPTNTPTSTPTGPTATPSETPTPSSTEPSTKTPTATPTGATPTPTNTPVGGEVDWCNLQYPPTMDATEGVISEVIYGQVYVEGVTPGTGQGMGVSAQVGYGMTGTFPDMGGWTWFAADYNADAGDNDEYRGTIMIPTAGTYDYSFRFSYLNGSYCYGDLDGSGNGYDPAQAGVITVHPYETPGPTSTPSNYTPTPPPSTQWCNLQWPPTMTSAAGDDTETVYGQVYHPDVTDKPGQGLGITADLGYGPDGDMPWEDSWVWTEAVYNVDAGNNDEYMATMNVPVAGTYDYAYRYSLDGGLYCYGDLNGSDDGYSPDQAGSLTVTDGSDTPTPEPNTPTPTNTVGPGTPTYTPIPPTNTPTPSPTNTVGPGTPTNTPVPPTNTPTPSPTNTAGPGSPTNTPIPTATPTQPPALGVTLEMPDTYYTPGETCYLNATLNNPGNALVDIAVVVLLDINIGEYWFWPTWIHYPPDVDFEIRTVATGSETLSIIPPFDWPSGAGSFSGAMFYGAMLNSSITELIGSLGMVTFGFGE